MKSKISGLLLVATLSLLGLVIHGFVPHRPYGSPPPSDYWSAHDKVPDHDRPSDHSSDTNLQRYRNPRDPNARLSTISPSDDSANHYRIRRASNDAFSTAVDKMLKISRVINGIALQQDITNGTVKPDVVIKELLDLSQLDFGNLEEMSKVVEAIQGLPEALSKDKKQAERIEKKFRLFDLMLETTKGAGDKVALPDKDAYSGEITALKQKKVSLSAFKDINEKLTGMADKLTDLLDSKQIDKTSAAKRFSDFKYYHSQLKSEDITTLVTSIDSPQLRKNMFEPLGKIQQALETYKANIVLFTNADADDAGPTGILKGYLEQLDTIRKKSVKVLGPLKTLDKVIRSASRQVSGDRQLDQISGFPNGFSDIVSIPNDLRDPWVKEAVDGQSDALVKAMEDLKIIAEKTRLISGSLKSGAGFSSLMDGVIESATALSAIPDTFEPLASNLLKPKLKVLLDEVTPPNAEAFASLYSNITSLTMKLVAMDDVLTVVSILRSKEYVEKLEAMEKLMTDGTDGEVTQRLTELRKNEGAKDVNKLLMGLKESLTVLKDPVTINGELEKIEQNFGEIDTFVAKPSYFLSLLSNLRKIEGVGQIKTALDALDQYRGYKHDFGNFGQLKNHVNEATKSLESLSKSFDAMKGAKNPESKSLVQSADVWKDSQTIGSATRVFRGIKLMSEWNKDVMNPAAKALITANSGKMTQEDQKNLKLLDTLDAELKKLKTGLTAISADPVASKTDSNLTSFSPVYSLAGKTNGVKYDFKAMSDSVDRLTKSLNNDKDLLGVKSKLDTLDSMGLDFAKHHSAISGVEKSLENLDKLFASLVEVVVVNNGLGAGGSAGSGTGSGTGSGAGAGDGGGAKEEQSKTMSYLLYALIVVVIILFIVVIVLLVRKRNQKDQHSDCKVIIPPSLFEYYVSNFFFRYTIFGALYSSVMGTAAALKLFFLNLYTGDAAQPQTKSLHDHQPIEIPYRRADVPLALKGRLQVENYQTYNFETGYIHGNVIEYPNKLRVAITQAPHMADKKLGRKENIGMYYAAAMEQQCKLMICLAPTGGDQCAQYFPAEKGAKLKFMDGKLVITCKKVENKWDGAVVRKLEVKFEGRKSFSMNHIQYEKWTGKVLPKKREALNQILSKMENSAFPVFIHCTDGLHQSAVLAQVLMNKEQLSTKKELDYGLSLQELRNYRVDAITSGEEYLEAAILTFEYLHYKIQEDIAAIDAGKTDGDVIQIDKIVAYNQKINMKTGAPPEVKEEPKPEEKKDEAEEDVSPVSGEDNAGSETMLAANAEEIKAKKEEKRARRAEEREEERRKKAEERRAKKRKDDEKRAVELTEEKVKPLLLKIQKLEEENKKLCEKDKEAHDEHEKKRKNAAVQRDKKDKRKKQRKHNQKKRSGSKQSKGSSQILPPEPSKTTSVHQKPDQLLDATQEEPAPDAAPNVEDNMKTAGE
ncbi:hypothetical protein GCK72_011591 [Caenorhabditis remanei]|uniref:Tyrosine-protein phosphatase domain-containing protein n=1 Tax=Caenorhabditis remanei TaxID=31234 RepID=A0A6A5H876_CAERE|nr:hypothetical protein GCK72_011591 [Caenorhabditis remanei]KAF1763325.1 hypothetical protein GCK72_011591 [Caenorhabditis remanei]